ncbi:hypothetical protein KSS87_010705 [Heliosperma pusillum]|nr:hypothetical protein KSS87_010705 [Heliosperma pusillum]
MAPAFATSRTSGLGVGGGGSKDAGLGLSSRDCRIDLAIFVKTAFKIGKDGVEAGTNLVPETVPRPVARLSVAIVATALSLLVLKSFVSTVFFSLGVMGFVYFVYLALNKDKGPKLNEKPGSTDEAIDQANKIMDKYK